MTFSAKIVNGGWLHLHRIYQKIAPCGAHSVAFWKIAILKISEILKKTHVLEFFLKISGCSVANRKRLCQELFPRLCQQVLRAIILKNSSSAVTSHRKIENWLRISIILLTLRNLPVLWLHETTIWMYYSSMMVTTSRNFVKL